MSERPGDGNIIVRLDAINKEGVDMGGQEAGLMDWITNNLTQQ